MIRALASVIMGWTRMRPGTALDVVFAGKVKPVTLTVDEVLSDGFVSSGVIYPFAAIQSLTTTPA